MGEPLANVQQQLVVDHLKMFEQLIAMQQRTFVDWTSLNVRLLSNKCRPMPALSAVMDTH